MYNIPSRVITMALMLQRWFCALWKGQLISKIYGKLQSPAQMLGVVVYNTPEHHEDMTWQ